MAMFFVVQSFLAGFYSMGLISYAARVIYKYERTEPETCKKNLAAIFMYIVCFAFLGGILSLFFIDRIFGLIAKGINVPSRFYLYIPVMMAFLMAIHGFSTNNLLEFQRNKQLFFVETAQFLLFLPAEIVGLVFFGFTVWDVILLQFVVQIAVTVLGIWIMKDWLSFSISKMKVIKEALKYSVPMIPMHFASWIQSQIDKIFLNNFITLKAVGLYSAGSQLANQYAFFTRPIATSIKPEISKRLDAEAPTIQKDIRDFFMVYCQASIFLFLVISLFSKEVVQLLFNVRFHECYKIVPIIVLGLIFSELTGIFHLKFVYKNKTIWFPITLVLGASFNAMANYLLIPKFDIMGAAIATSATLFIVMVFCLFVSQHLHRTEYALSLNFIPLIASVAMIIIMQNLHVGNVTLITLKSGVCAVYALGIDLFLKRNNNRYAELRGLVLNKLTA